jgi:adenylate cyclase
MKKAILFAFVIYQLSGIIAQAQQTNLDSLLGVWNNKSQPDSNRVKAYNDYIWYGYLFSRPDTAEALAEALHTFAKKHKYPKASANAYKLQGVANAVQGNYPRALEYYEKCLAINEKTGDKRAIAGALGNIGNIYKEQADYPRALKYYEKCLSIQKEIGNKPDIARTLLNIGDIYYSQGNYPRALEYKEKSLAIMEEIGDKSGIARALGGIGNIYGKLDEYSRALEYFKKCLAINEKTGDKNSIALNLNWIGVIYHKQDDYSRALEYYEKSLAIREEIGDKNGIADNLINIGAFYADQANYPRALEYYEKSLAINVEIGDKKDIASCLGNIGLLYQKQGNNTRALGYFQKSLSLAEEIGDLTRQKDAYEDLYNSYKALGNSDKALEYYEKMIVARDSIYNEENTKKLVQIDMQYEFNRKEAAAKAEQDKKDAIAGEEMEKQKLVRNSFIGGFAVVLLFAGVFFRQRNKIGKEKARSEELLLNILPEEVAEELKAKGNAEAKLIDDATVLFTDFKGFTGMSELLTPRELVADLNYCFSAFDGIMQKYGIEKIKTIGDAYMAAGGLPTPNATHAKDVVLAALEICDFIEKGKVDKMANNLPYFEIRVGVHTGPVVAGIVGVKKFQYDIWGDTVNTASRMESAGEEGKVNISQNTYELLKEDSEFNFVSRGKIEAKGKGEIEMYFVSKA